MVITILPSMPGQQEQHIVITLCMPVAVLVGVPGRTVIPYMVETYMVVTGPVGTRILMPGNINPVAETSVYTMVESTVASIGIAVEPLREQVPGIAKNSEAVNRNFSLVGSPGVAGVEEPAIA